MNQKFFILSLMLALAASQTYSLTSCTCAQLLSEGDCTKNASLGCSWDSTKKACAVSTTPVTPVMTYAAYCDTFAETDCPKAKPCTDCGSYAACAWVDSKCTYFTGCTAFAKTTDSDCQAISNRCITDGTHCVEVDACNTYKKQLPCVKNTAGSLCYWDATNNTCVDANTCDKLPVNLATDSDCRALISTCTTKTGGGCVDSGNNCSDQTLEIQCVWNKLKTTACYWDGAACKDRICDNAPTSLTTDDACKLFRVDGSCTTKANGGCVTRTTCSAATIQASCVKNSSGGDCYWNGTACVDKNCANAPVTMTTNSACAGFVTGCITKSGGGCVANGACSVANVQAACVKNSSNQDCIWDTTCKEKTCANAPTTNNTHDLCTSYLSTCTVKTGGGCQNRTCANAPVTLTTNDACEAYLTGNNCITKSGGGCVTNTTCAAITLEAACVKNSSGQTCFWDSASSSCKDKTCLNAPSTNTTHDLCQAFLNTCTVNSTSAGCVEKTCENSLVLAICDKDTSNRACIWKGKCYKKQCVLASSATTSHADCQTYSSGCTLSNTGSGCVTLPLKCEAITIEAACQMKSNGQPCGWTGTQCIDKACSTASKTFSTTTQCQTHLSSCVANNPATVNGSVTIQGCQDLPTTCAGRKSSENCEITRSGFPTCLWVSSSSTCVEKSCTTASTVGTTGALSTGQFSFANCQNYISICTTTNAQGVCTATSYPCISNNAGDGCIAKPSSCSSLIQSNCQAGSKSTGDCYWNGAACVDKTCANIALTTHNSCNTTLNTCTVNNGATACQPLATACTSYTTSENCKLTSANKKCVWTGLACRSATCADAPDDNTSDTDGECFNYQTPSETCTVVYKVGAQGCVPRSANCTDYMTQAQCHKTLTNLTANDDCKWIVDKCYATSSFASGACTSFKGTQTMCQGYRVGCTNTNSATSSTACTLDCTLKTGTGLAFSDCQAVDTTCSVNSTGTGCIAIQSACTGYGQTAANCFRSTAGLCAMNAASPATCQAVTQASECVLVTGKTGLDHAKCQAYHTSCTSLNDGTGCQEFKATCPAFTGDAAHCTASQQGKCYLSGSDCVRFSTCAAISGIGLTDAKCAGYNADCTVNAAGTACQEQKATCAVYLTQDSCTTSKDTATADKCAWSGTACVAVTTVATQCAFVTGSGLDDTQCATYNAGCVANSTGTACQEKKATCAAYTTTAACGTSTAGKCYWNSAASPAACISITTVATDCQLVLGSGLDDAKCGAYLTGCVALSTGAGCQEKKATCAAYTTTTACGTSTAGKCYWNSAASPAACISITTASSDCQLVLGSGLDDTKCGAYLTDCVALSTGAGCQEKKATCAGYTTTAACGTSGAGKCYWNSAASPAACISITTVATDCQLVLGSGLDDAKCGAYLTGCVALSTGAGCQEKKATCGVYTTTAACGTSTAGKCYWNSAASPAACISITTVATDCQLVLGSGLDDTKCSAYNAGCTSLVDGTACQEEKANCKDYTTQNKCTSTSSVTCIWFENACYSITAVSCSSITGTSLDHTKCQAYNTKCTSITDGTACQDFKTTCEQYPGTAAGCTKTATSKCYVYNSACITISNVATDCAKITGSNLTYDTCQSYNTGCSVNRAKTACVQQQALCSGYSSAMTSCYKSAAGLCIAGQSGDTSCVAASTASTCDAVFLGAGNYNDANCSSFKTGCTVNGSACTARTCANATGITFNHANCNSWLNTCTVNSGSSACQAMASKCADQQSTACQYSVEGECVVVNSACVRKTCDTATADASFDSDSECGTYQQSCTVARLGACQARTACASYKSLLQCKFNTSGGKCFWNPTAKTCVDLNCGNIEATTTYDSHSECVAVDSTLLCTVRATNGAAVPGCMARGSCSSYTIEDQCRTNSNGGECVWNTNANLPAPACQDKSCTSAPTSTATHNDCFAYYTSATVKCTVAATPSNSGGAATLGGCQQTAACSSYIDKEQCQINANGDPCGWNGTQCADKSCATAPATADYDDDTKCRAYFSNKCTVSETGQGCVDIPATCETMTQKQCNLNKNGDPCYWTGTACITKSCDNAPDSTATADDCNTYLSGCTLDSVKCKTKVCEDFAFATDALCKQAISTCTTNGTNCVTRGTCFQALSQSGCVTSSTGQQCEWIPAVLNAQNVVTSPAYCTIKTCSTAPLTLTSEAACASYFTNCTTKNGGGCVTKSSCSAVTIDVACTTALNGTVCAWDSAQNKCRDKDCQDFSGTTHAACQTQRAGCTAGANGKCARVQNCEQTTVRAACIEGSNGPCLWIDKYPNNDGTKGACFRYTSCKSLQWNNDASCKWISNKCTTNGSNCVGITLCSETNTDGGCVTGYDGACIQSVPALNSSDPKVCKPYTSCADAFYTTHSDCQIASNKCTTNGTTGCIALGACSSYTSQAGCYFNDKGAVLQSGAIVSTGLCTWDTTASSCRDQTCADLTGTTHATCSSQLSTCTSDGTTCLLKGACSSYSTQTACTTAVGSDGICYWELASATNNNTAKCRLLTCADIQNGTSTSVCVVALSTCVSNGTACIPKANCSTYTNKIACNSGGLDGICVFTQSTATGAVAGTGTCALMTSCTTANNDQIACQAARDRCSWTPPSGSGATAVASKCATHTCATNQATNGACTRFLNWDKKTQQVCTLVSGTCTATDPSTLSSNDCFLVSGYTYTWNASTSKCGVCTAVVVQPNTSDNNTNNTDNNTTTDSGYILGMSIVLGYLMF
uniref:Surface antigen A n=1 Tax=Paramecium tetraurelia TaxID=5888 RepID=Q6PQK6_PARTE|nr:surface antigen A [Paramecium tetraurelia]